MLNKCRQLNSEAEFEVEVFNIYSVYKHWSHETLTGDGTDSPHLWTNTITTDRSNFIYLFGDGRSLCECEERKN